MKLESGIEKWQSFLSHRNVLFSVLYWGGGYGLPVLILFQEPSTILPQTNPMYWGPECLGIDYKAHPLPGWTGGSSTGLRGKSVTPYAWEMIFYSTRRWVFEGQNSIDTHETLPGPAWHFIGSVHLRLRTEELSPQGSRQKGQILM